MKGSRSDTGVPQFLRKVTPFLVILFSVVILYFFAYPAFLFYLFEGNPPFVVPGWLENFFRDTSYPAFEIAQEFALYGRSMQWLDRVF